MSTFTIKDFTLGTAKKMLSFLVNTDENIPAKILVDSAGNEVMGLVAASPAANTALGRLKTIADTLTTMSTNNDGLEALATTLNGLVDGLETLIGTTNTTLTTIDSRVDGLEALITTLNGYADGLEGLIGSTNTAIGTTNSALTTIQGYVDGLETLITATNAALVAATPAGENFIGSVGGKTLVLDVTWSLDTSQYAAGDVIEAGIVCTNALRVTDGTGVLQSLMLIDKDDQGAAMDVYILDANNALGTENAAPSISDPNAVGILGYVSIAAADWKDLGGVKVCHKTGLTIPVKAASGTRHIYIGAVNGSGTPTFTAAGIVSRLGIFQD